MTTNNQKRKFGMIDNLAYAAGDFGCNMSFALKGTMAIFWTQFMGMDLWYSLLLIIVQVWDAINDPLIGSMVDADKHQYKRNKFLQYIWVGSIGLIVGGACCFLPFPNAPVWAKMIIFIAGYVVWDAFYTVANVPYGSLLSLISSKPADRASLSAWRSVGSMFGNMLFQTYLVAAGARNLGEAIKLLWMFRVPWDWAYTAGTVSDWIAQFSFGFYSIMLTSTIIGLVVNVLFKPRTWCTFCPMGTMTQLICKLKAGEKL